MTIIFLPQILFQQQYHFVLYGLEILRLRVKRVLVYVYLKLFLSYFLFFSIVDLNA